MTLRPIPHRTQREDIRNAGGSEDDLLIIDSLNDIPSLILYRRLTESVRAGLDCATRRVMAPSGIWFTPKQSNL